MSREARVRRSNMVGTTMLLSTRPVEFLNKANVRVRRSSERSASSSVCIGITSRSAAASALIVNQCSALVSVSLGDESSDRNGGKIGVSVVAGPIFKGKLLGFDEVMQVFHAAETVGLEIVGFQNIQDLQSSDALAIGRQFPNVVPSVVGGNGFDPFALMAGQVFC